VSEAQRSAEESRTAANSGLKFIPKTKGDNDVGRATFGYFDFNGFDYYFDDFDPTVECHIALPQENFQQLLDGCLSGRVSGVYFGGNGGALSSGIENSYQPGPSGSVRDVILLEGVEFDTHIDTLIIDYCGEPEVPEKSEEEIEEKPRSPSEIEKILVSLERVTSGIRSLRFTVIKTSWILAAALIIPALIK